MLSKELVAASTVPLVLSILEEGESYGYALIQRVRELSDGQIAWTEGMLYPVLHWMEDQDSSNRNGAKPNQAETKVLPVAKGWPKKPGGRAQAMADSSSNSLQTMETPTSFNLNDALRRWHAGLRPSPNFGDENLVELEAHVRESVAVWQSKGLTEEEAFLLATRRLGHPSGTGSGVCQSQPPPNLAGPVALDAGGRGLSRS